MVYRNANWMTAGDVARWMEDVAWDDEDMPEPDADGCPGWER